MNTNDPKVWGAKYTDGVSVNRGTKGFHWERMRALDAVRCWAECYWGEPPRTPWLWWTP